jgi:hypothetical protein
VSPQADLRQPSSCFGAPPASVDHIFNCNTHTHQCTSCTCALPPESTRWPLYRRAITASSSSRVYR